MQYALLAIHRACAAECPGVSLSPPGASRDTGFRHRKSSRAAADGPLGRVTTIRPTRIGLAQSGVRLEQNARDGSSAMTEASTIGETIGKYPSANAPRRCVSSELKSAGRMRPLAPFPSGRRLDFVLPGEYDAIDCITVRVGGACPWQTSVAGTRHEIAP